MEPISGSGMGWDILEGRKDVGSCSSRAKFMCFFGVELSAVVRRLVPHHGTLLDGPDPIPECSKEISESLQEGSMCQCISLGTPRETRKSGHI